MNAVRIVRRGLLAALLALPLAAQAQWRAIPAAAKRAELHHLEGMAVSINGTAVLLPAGAQIRDARNLIVVPSAIVGTVLARVLVDAQGQVTRVWILSPEEAAAKDPE